jgi:Carbon-nitrogen hydrolase
VRPGTELPVFHVSEATFRVLICNDAHFIEPARILAARGTQLLVVPVHGAYRPAKEQALRARGTNVLIARAVENGIPLVSAYVAGQGARVSHGTTAIIDGDGAVLAAAQPPTEDFVIADGLRTAADRDRSSRENPSMMGQFLGSLGMNASARPGTRRRLARQESLQRCNQFAAAELDVAGRREAQIAIHTDVDVQPLAGRAGNPDHLERLTSGCGHANLPLDGIVTRGYDRSRIRRSRTDAAGRSEPSKVGYTTIASADPVPLCSCWTSDKAPQRLSLRWYVQLVLAKDWLATSQKCDRRKPPISDYVRPRVKGMSRF